MSQSQDIHYLIIDDEPIAHRILKDYAGRLSHLVCVGQCHHPLQALPLFRAHHVDLIFLDLHMPEMKGFDFLQALVAPPQVIVTTAYEHYALQGYELNVVDYLLKPITEARFLQAVQKVRPQPAAPPRLETRASPMIEDQAQEPGKVVVKGDKTYHYLPVEAIDHVEAFGNYCLVHMGKETILTPRKISDLAESWKRLGFLRVHKSYLVATRHIETLTTKSLQVRGKTIPIGQAFKRGLYRELGLK